MSFWILEYGLPNIILYQSLYFSLVLSRVCEREHCPAASHHTVKWWIFRELKQRVKMKAGLWWTEAMETRSNGLGRLHPQRFQRQLERWAAWQTRLWQRLQYSERGWTMGKSVLLARRGRNNGLWTQDGTPTVPDHTRDLETRSGIVSSPQPYV